MDWQYIQNNVNENIDLNLNLVWIFFPTNSHDKNEVDKHDILFRL